jgi:hypothetical protein
VASAGPDTRCGACGAGPLVPRKRYRLRGWAVAVGYTLLVPSLPCLLVAGTLFFYFVWEYRLSEEDTIRLMREASVPGVLIAKAKRTDYLSDERRAELTLRQRWAYDLARRKHEPPYFGADVAALEAAMLCGAFVAAAAVGALLVRKRSILQCERCGAGAAGR